jgi:hypothetical protein
MSRQKTREVYVDDGVMATAGVPAEDFDVEEAFEQAGGSFELVLRDGNGKGSVVRVYKQLLGADVTADDNIRVTRTLPDYYWVPPAERGVRWGEYVDHCGEGTKCVPRDIYSEAVYHREELGLKDDIERYRDVIDRLADTANGKFDARLYAMGELLTQGLQERLDSFGVDIYATPANATYARAYQSMVEGGLYRDMMDVGTCYDMLKDALGKHSAMQLAEVEEVSDDEAVRRATDVENYMTAMSEYVDAVSSQHPEVPHIRQCVLCDAACVMAGVEGYEPKWVGAKHLASEHNLRNAADVIRDMPPQVVVSVSDDFPDEPSVDDYYDL